MSNSGVSFRRLRFPRPANADLEPSHLAPEQGQSPERDRPRDGPYLVLGEDQVVYAGDDVILVTEWLIGPKRLADLRRVAGRVLRERDGLTVAEVAEEGVDPVSIAVLDLPPEYYWPLAHDRPDFHPKPSSTLELLPASARAVVVSETRADVPVETVVSMVSGLCAMAGAEVVSVEEVYRLSTEAGWEIRVEIGRRGATARDLIELARECGRGVEALSGPVTDRQTVAALIRAGVATALVGMRESEWFEAKRQLWDLDTEAGKIELLNRRTKADAEVALAQLKVAEDPEETAHRLGVLKQLGPRIAIDDFGTGFSSLSYLRQFPVDILKIDRSFIETITEDDPLPPIVRGLLDLGHTLDLEIVAEGIELDVQRSWLREQSCGFGQGFLFARPLPASDAERLLDQTRKPLRSS